MSRSRGVAYIVQGHTFGLGIGDGRFVLQLRRDVSVSLTRNLGKSKPAGVVCIKQSAVEAPHSTRVNGRHCSSNRYVMLYFATVRWRAWDYPLFRQWASCARLGCEPGPCAEGCWYHLKRDAANTFGGVRLFLSVCPADLFTPPAGRGRRAPGGPPSPRCAGPIFALFGCAGNKKEKKDKEKKTPPAASTATR